MVLPIRDSSHSPNNIAVCEWCLNDCIRSECVGSEIPSTLMCDSIEAVRSTHAKSTVEIDLTKLLELFTSQRFKGLTALHVLTVCLGWLYPLHFHFCFKALVLLWVADPFVNTTIESSIRFRFILLYCVLNWLTVK